jgi:hypothetical protein
MSSKSVSAGRRDRLPGGRADELLPEDFDQEELVRGTEHELEHTDDPVLAQEIAMDHLAEDERYYERLDAMERQTFRANTKWTRQYMNDLPDEAFLYIEPGGSRDEEGKTEPRYLRHFPYMNHTGNVDMPHLKNALSRIPQSSLPAATRDRVAAKAERLYDQQRMAANSGYYIWIIGRGGKPLDEGPYGPHDLQGAKTSARIGATQGSHDRAVSLGRNPTSPSFTIVRQYRAGTGERVV